MMLILRRLLLLLRSGRVEVGIADSFIACSWISSAIRRGWGWGVVPWGRGRGLCVFVRSKDVFDLSDETTTIFR